MNNNMILNEVKKVTHRDLLDILPNLDPELVKGAVAGAQFKDLFFRISLSLNVCMVIP